MGYFAYRYVPIKFLELLAECKIRLRDRQTTSIEILFKVQNFSSTFFCCHHSHSMGHLTLQGMVISACIDVFFLMYSPHLSLSLSHVSTHIYLSVYILLTKILCMSHSVPLNLMFHFSYILKIPDFESFSRKANAQRRCFDENYEKRLLNNQSLQKTTTSASNIYERVPL